MKSHPNFWKPFLLAAVAACMVPTATASAQETAYAAMRVVKAAKGDDSLAKLVEVRGKEGGPQPEAWVLLFNDPAARGGVREIVVQDGAILSERTPLSGFSGVGDLPVLPSARLNLDSDGAFRIANEEAKREGVGFHWVNYTLRFDAATGEGPLWVLDLVDIAGVSAGSVVISAETLGIVRGLRATSAPITATQPSAPLPPPATARNELEASPSTPEPRGGILGTAQQFGTNLGMRVWNTAESTAERVRDTTESTTGRVREIVTGEPAEGSGN